MSQGDNMRSRFVPERQTTSLKEPDPVTPDRLQSRTIPPSLSQGDKIRGHFVPERQTTSLKEPDPVTPNRLQSRTIPPSLSQEDKMRGHFVPRRQNEEAILSQGDKLRGHFVPRRQNTSQVCPKATKCEPILSQSDKMRSQYSPDTGNRMTVRSSWPAARAAQPDRPTCGGNNFSLRRPRSPTGYAFVPAGCSYAGFFLNPPTGQRGKRRIHIPSVTTWEAGK